MFTYLIAPNRACDPSFIFAITIHENKLTLYTNEHVQPPEFIGVLNSLDRILYTISIQDSYAWYSVAAAVGSFQQTIGRAHPTHASFHTHPDELKISHGHLPYSNNITAKNMEEFLSRLCFSKPFIRDFSSKFQQAAGKNVITSNLPFYLEKSRQLPQYRFPTIYEHQQCLSIDKYQGCVENNPLSPQKNLIQSCYANQSQLDLCFLNRPNNRYNFFNCSTTRPVFQNPLRLSLLTSRILSASLIMFLILHYLFETKKSKEYGGSAEKRKNGKRSDAQVFDKSTLVEPVNNRMNTRPQTHAKLALEKRLINETDETVITANCNWR